MKPLSTIAVLLLLSHFFGLPQAMGGTITNLTFQETPTTLVSTWEWDPGPNPNNWVAPPILVPGQFWDVILEGHAVALSGNLQDTSVHKSRPHGEDSNLFSFFGPNPDGGPAPPNGYAGVSNTPSPFVASQFPHEQHDDFFLLWTTAAPIFSRVTIHFNAEHVGGASGVLRIPEPATLSLLALGGLLLTRRRR